MVAKGAHRVVWLSPSPPAEQSAELVADAVGARAEIGAKDLEVWAPELPPAYSIATEVEGVSAFAKKKGWDSFHLVGFSAGATVALAATLEQPSSVKTLTLIEPAYIGEDDDWSPIEAGFRARMRDVFALPIHEHHDAFRRAVVHPDERLPARAPVRADLVQRGAVLERQALRQCGFASADLAGVSQPTLIVTGGRSHPRFSAINDRLCAVLPDVSSAMFPERHHLSSPHRNEPGRMARLLLRLWGEGDRRDG